MGIRYLNHAAIIRCTHGGTVRLFPPSVRSYYIEGRPVITDMDLLRAVIIGCPQVGPGLKPCTRIVSILMGRALQIKVDGETPILKTLKALTDGVAPGVCAAWTDGNSNDETLGLPQAREQRNLVPLTQTGDDPSQAWYWGLLRAGVQIALGLLMLVALALVSAAVAYAVFGVGLAAWTAAMIAGAMLFIASLIGALVHRYGQTGQLWLSIGLALLDALGIVGIIESVSGTDSVTHTRLSDGARTERGVVGLAALGAIILGARAAIKGPPGGIYTRPPTLEWPGIAEFFGWGKTAEPQRPLLPDGRAVAPERPPVSEEVQTLSGHGHARHGWQTTPVQHDARVRTGMAPDGEYAPTPRSTRFDSPEAESDAVARARARTTQRVATGKQSTVIEVGPDGTAELPRDKSVVTGYPGGYGSGVEVARDPITGKPLPGRPVVPTSQYPNAHVVLQFNPATGTWDPVTQFPTNMTVTK